MIGVIVALAVVGGAVYWYTKVLYLPWLPLLCYPYYGSVHGHAEMRAIAGGARLEPRASGQ